jgi:hypothetical protein
LARRTGGFRAEPRVEKIFDDHRWKSKQGELLTKKGEPQNRVSGVMTISRTSVGLPSEVPHLRLFVVVVDDVRLLLFLERC